jgi:uncharacterized protein (TIGR02099 family)
MPKQIAIRIANTIWFSTALLIVLAATAVAIGRELMPNINFGSEPLSRYASQRTGADISIHDLHGQWTRLFPEFTVSEIDIRAHALQVHAENIHIDIDIFRTLLMRTPAFDRLEIASAQVTYSQDPSAAAADPEKLWATLYTLLSNNIHISNVDVNIQNFSKNHQLHIADFRIEQRLLEKRFFLKMPGAKKEQILSATGSLTGKTLASSAGKIYLNINNWPMDEWLPTATENSSSILQNILAASWQASGESWINWEGTDKISNTTRLQIHSNPTATTLPETVNSLFSLNWQRGTGSTLQLQQLQIQKQQAAIDVLQDTRISFETPTHWHLQTPRLSLDNLSSLFSFLPENNLKFILTSLHPAGDLTNVDMQWDNSQPIASRMHLRANAVNISTGPWSGVPAFTEVNGYLETGIGYGFIDLDSHNGFSMFYPGIYHEPLAFQTAAGRVQWHWLPEEKTVLVGSDHARLTGEGGDADGNFWLDLPLAGSDRKNEMNLAIGLRNSHADYRDKLLPYTLPENLLAWLKDSIGKAHIRDAGFIYRGPLSGHDAFSRAVQFYANFDNGDLQFEKHWPRLTQLQGKVLVDDGNVEVRTQGGQIYNTAIESAMVTVSGYGQDMNVHVNGRARGYAEDGLRILRETPLQQSLSGGLDNWRITHGLLTAGVNLDIPLNGNTALRKEDVRISLFDTQLAMDDLHLQFDEMRGDLSYQTDTGLLSPTLTGNLFQQPIEMRINSTKKQDSLLIAIDGSGKANFNNIAQWSRLRALQLLSGDFEYTANLTLGPFGKKKQERVGQLQINSDLLDTTLKLPAPLLKNAGEKAPFNLLVDIFQGNRQDYRIDYNNRITGALSIRQGKLYSGDILVLADTATAKAQSSQKNTPPATQGPLRIHGKLPDGDLQPWFDVVGTYNRLPPIQEMSDTSYPEFSFAMDDARWRDLGFPNLQLDISHPDKAWKVRFDSTHAKGYVNFFDNAAADKSVKPEVVVNELKIYHQKKTDSAETNGTNPATTPAINFAEVPSANIRIDHLIFNDMDIGNINTELLSQPDSLQFSKLQMTGPGFAVRGKDSNPDADLLWRRNADNVYQSEFHGILHMQGEQTALKHIGVDPFVRGENIYLASDLVWAGSPLDFSIPLLYGRVQTHGQKGKYLQANPNATMQAISVINIANWARRLRLDFSDLTSDGISFDEYQGEISFNNGDMAFSQPLIVQSPSSSMTLAGVSHLNTGQLDLKLTATLPVSSNATWITALAGGLPAAAGVYLVSKVFGDQIKNITSLTYTITGASADPDIRFERIAAPQEKKPTEKKNTDK